MHFDTPSNVGAASVTSDLPWYRQLNSYHWLVLIVASLGWLFDTMDQQLFNLARRSLNLLCTARSGNHIRTCLSKTVCDSAANA